MVSASLGVVALAGGLFGWLVSFATTWHRVLLVAGALFLIKPGVYTDLVGLGLLGAVIAAQLVARRNLAESAAPRA